MSDDGSCISVEPHRLAGHSWKSRYKNFTEQQKWQLPYVLIFIRNGACARHCSKRVKWIKSFNLPNNSTGCSNILISPVPKWENWEQNHLSSKWLEQGLTLRPWAKHVLQILQTFQCSNLSAIYNIFRNYNVKNQSSEWEKLFPVVLIMDLYLQQIMNFYNSPIERQITQLKFFKISENEDISPRKILTWPMTMLKDAYCH